MERRIENQKENLNGVIEEKLNKQIAFKDCGDFKLCYRNNLVYTLDTLNAFKIRNDELILYFDVLDIDFEKFLHKASSNCNNRILINNHSDKKFKWATVECECKDSNGEVNKVVFTMNDLKLIKSSLDDAIFDASRVTHFRCIFKIDETVCMDFVKLDQPKIKEEQVYTADNIQKEISKLKEQYVIEELSKNKRMEKLLKFLDIE